VNAKRGASIVMDIKVERTSLHRIDLSMDRIGKPIVADAESDFKPYVQKLVDELYESPRYKSYRFASTETEIAKQLAGISTEAWDNNSQVIAERLLRVEKAAQERIQHINDLRSGSLVQIYAEIEGQKTVILTKVDHNAYLDESSLIEKLGLPVQQRAQKTGP